jgi:hypothetical protein
MAEPTLPVVPPGPISSAFKRELEQSLAAVVPPGKRGGLLAVVDKDGTKLYVAAALTDDGDWQVAGNIGTSWGGDVTGKVILSGSW